MAVWQRRRVIPLVEWNALHDIFKAYPFSPPYATYFPPGSNGSYWNFTAYKDNNPCSSKW